MAMTLLGKKLGMTRVYNENGTQMPVTVVEAGPCYVSQLKSPEADGYAAVQIAFEDLKPRRSTKPVIGHDAKAGLAPKRHHREFRVEPDELAGYELGQALTVENFAEFKFVDVVGRSKGKGYQGVMKRWNFKGQLQSHGVERKHRSPGSIAGHAFNAGGSGGPKKGKKMAGQMGNERVTVRSLDLVAVDVENNVLLVKGAVPGPNGGIVEIRPAKRLTPKKRAVVAAAS
mgnify:CR=1 FL=1